MYGSQQEMAVLGDILTVLLNTSMYTFEVAPVMTMIEKECIDKLSSFIWGSGEINDGVFTPGSSISNMNAMMMARNAKFPETHLSGLYECPKVSIFVTDQAHYSFLKGALFLGFGKNSIVKVKSDNNDRIDIPSLEKAIEAEKQKGNTPLMVVGVAGTTFSGKFDNLDALGKIAHKNKMWFHVDAAYGGSLLFSEKEKNKFVGVSLADSVSWSLHKIMGVPLVCAVFLTKEQGALNRAFSVDAGYLFHDNDDHDLGQKSLQCGRRVDALKLWLAWKKEGTEGFAKRVDSIMKTSTVMAAAIDDNSRLELLTMPESPIVCFRYFDRNLTEDQMNDVNKKIRENIFTMGQYLFNYSTYRDKIYLRCVVSDPEFDLANVSLIMDEITNTGTELVEEIWPSTRIENILPSA